MMHPATIIDLSGAWLKPDAVDFEASAADGIQGVILETNVGTSKIAHVDELAKRATDAGLHLAVYFYARPKEDAEAQATIALEAAHRIGALSVWDDAEDPGGLKAEPLADFHSKIFEVIDGAEYPAGLYLSPAFARFSLGRHATRFRKRPLWLAQYGAEVADVPPPWLAYALWQHAGNTCAYDPARREYLFGPRAVAAIVNGTARLIAQPGKVDGVPGEVDCSIHADGLTVEEVLSGASPHVDVDVTTVLGRQRALRSLGFEPGGLDGLWGPKSQRALDAFLASSGGDDAADVPTLLRSALELDTPKEPA